ncbi:MAG: hypothetical protein HY937_00005 [Nitrosomonadales bacterium]|nr:hypothetical protein [Nitrosomonadales bacterium]
MVALNLASALKISHKGLFLGFSALRATVSNSACISSKLKQESRRLAASVKSSGTATTRRIIILQITRYAQILGVFHKPVAQAGIKRIFHHGVNVKLAQRFVCPFSRVRGKVG